MWTVPHDLPVQQDVEKINKSSIPEQLEQLYSNF